MVRQGPRAERGRQDRARDCLSPLRLTHLLFYRTLMVVFLLGHKMRYEYTTWLSEAFDTCWDVREQN
jgi:hypothetical protein